MSGIWFFARYLFLKAYLLLDVCVLGSLRLAFEAGWSEYIFHKMSKTVFHEKKTEQCQKVQILIKVYSIA